MRSYVGQYHGIRIEKVCGYYYPECNGNAEFKDIFGVKEYLRDCFLPAMKSLRAILYSK